MRDVQGNEDESDEGNEHARLSLIDDAYQAAAALDYLLGAALDAPVPASHMRVLLKPLLQTLDAATGG